MPKWPINQFKPDNRHSGELPVLIYIVHLQLLRLRFLWQHPAVLHPPQSERKKSRIIQNQINEIMLLKPWQDKKVELFVGIFKKYLSFLKFDSATFCKKTWIFWASPQKFPSFFFSQGFRNRVFKILDFKFRPLNGPLKLKYLKIKSNFHFQRAKFGKKS